MKNCLLAVLLAPILVIAQNNKTESLKTESQHIDNAHCKSYFNIETQIDPTEVSALSYAEDFVKKHLESDYSLKLVSSIESPEGWHFFFHQYYQDTKVYRGDLKINLDKNGNITSIFDNTFEVDNGTSSVFPSEDVVKNWVFENYLAIEHTLVKMETENTWFNTGDDFIPSVRIEINDSDERYYETILDKEGKVIYYRDLLSYYGAAATDTPATALVFMPDPITTAHTNYGTPYADNNDNDVLQLNNERQSVTINAGFTSGFFTLSSPTCNITEFSSPSIQPAQKTNPDFEFTRSESGFEDVNVFYHITTFQDYVQSLGFTNLGNYPIDVDCHALNGADNSNFNPSWSTPRLSFGEGGVDDAEDADVVIHEYGHALSHSGSPGTNNGTERQALDEAFGDYLCSSYSRSLDDYKWENVFGWDGHNEFWNGRSSVSTDHYPEDLVFHLYSDADIWSATLMQIWGDIGREITDALQLQTMYGLSSNMTMRDAAYLFLQADETLYGSAHATPIITRMVARGLLPPEVGINDVAPEPTFHLLNSAAFSTGIGEAWIELPKNSKTAINIYDISGKLLLEQEVMGTKFYLNPENFKSGVYLITVWQDGLSDNFKILKR